MFRTPKNEGVVWQWDLYPESETLAARAEGG